MTQMINMKSYYDTDSKDSVVTQAAADDLKNSGYNPYLVGLMDPTSESSLHIIPDENASPYYMKKGRITANLTGASDYIITYMPFTATRYKVMLGARVIDPISSLPAIGFSTTLGLDEDLGLKNDGIRITDGVLELFVSGVNGINYVIDGRVDANTFDTWVPFMNFDPSNLSAYGTNALRNISVADGIVALALPVANDQPYRVVPASQNRRSYEATNTDGFAYNFSSGAPFQDPVATNNILNTFQASVDYTRGVACLGAHKVSLTLTVTPIAPCTITLSGSYLNNNAVRVANTTITHYCATTVQQTFTLSIDNYSLFPITHWTATTTVPFSSISYGRFVVTKFDNNANNKFPMHVIRVTGASATSYLNLTVTENIQCMPNLAQTSDIDPKRGSPGYAPDDLMNAMFMIRSSGLLKPIYSRSNYIKLKDAGAFTGYSDRDTIRKAYAWSFSDIWKGIKNIARNTLDYVPSILSNSGYKDAASVFTAIRPVINPIFGSSASITKGSCNSWILEVLDITIEEAEKYYGKDYVLLWNKKVYKKIPLTMRDLKDGDIIWTDEKEYPKEKEVKTSSVTAYSTSASSSSSSSSSKSNSNFLLNATIQKGSATTLVAPSTLSAILESKSSSSGEMKGSDIKTDETVAISSVTELAPQTNVLINTTTTTIAFFAKNGYLQPSSLFSVAFPYIVEEKAKLIPLLGYLIKTPKPLHYQGYTYKYIEHANGVFISKTIGEQKQALALINEFKQPGYYTAFSYEDTIFSGTSFLGALFCVLRQIPIPGCISADYDFKSRELFPVDKTRTKALVSTYYGVPSYLCVPDGDSKLPTFSSIMATKQVIKACSVRNIAELYLIPVRSAWMDALKVKGEVKTEEELEMYLKSQSEDIQKRYKGMPISNIASLMRKDASKPPVGVAFDFKEFIEMRRDAKPEESLISTKSNEWTKAVNYILTALNEDKNVPKILRASIISKMQTNALPNAAADYELNADELKVITSLKPTPKLGNLIEALKKRVYKVSASAKKSGGKTKGIVKPTFTITTSEEFVPSTA